MSTMVWAKLDDRFHSNKKLAQLGARLLPGAGLHSLAISWSASELTDGFIPTLQVHRLAGKDTSSLERALVDVGLWEEVANGYYIHDFLDYNPCREEVLAQREARSQAGKRGAEGRWQKPWQMPSQEPCQMDGNNDGKQMAKAMAKPCPVPVPVPDSKSTSYSREAGSIFAYWVEVMDKPKAKLTKDRLSKIQARLREGYTEGEIRQAIDGCRSSAWHMGDNPNGTTYNDLARICGSGADLEGFRDRTARTPATADDELDALCKMN